MTTPPQAHEQEIFELAERYLLGELSAQELARFEHLLQASPQAVSLMLSYLRQAGMLRVIFSEKRRFAARIRQMCPDDILRVLQEIEAASDDSGIRDITELLAERENPGPIRPNRCGKPAYSIGMSDLALVSGYVAQKVLFNKKFVAGAIAALLVIGLYVLIPSGDDKPKVALPRIESKPSERSTLAATLTATLTDADEARWSSGDRAIAFGIGDAIAPGRLITLENGLAQLTTPLGAKATFEAPCTFEVLDDGNALRLHRGRMVGLVQSSRAKYFTIRTPHMDVVDLGTRFGIDASNTLATEVHVFEGSVEVSRPDADQSKHAQQLLKAGHALRADADRPELIEIDQDPLQFASLATDGHLPAGSAAHREARQAGIVRIAGDVAWSSMRPRELVSRYELEQGPQAYLYSEISGLTLDQDLPLTIHETGTTRRFEGLKPGTAAAGTVIRTYFICLNAGADGGEIQCTGGVTFEGEILGVISRSDEWFTFIERMKGQSDQFFTFRQEGLGPSLEDDPNDPLRDEIRISPDRRCLSFQLGGRAFAEIIRVVVREPVKEQSP